MFVLDKIIDSEEYLNIDLHVTNPKDRCKIDVKFGPSHVFKWLGIETERDIGSYSIN